MVLSLASWSPNININMPLLRRKCAENGKDEWTQELLDKYETIKEIIGTQKKSGRQTIKMQVLGKIRDFLI